MPHDAFLSYSHSDAALARELERGLEQLAKPLLKLRALDVFRDETGLASSPALWATLVEHLGASEWFLMLCSRQAAASAWCSREVAWWLEHRSASRFLILLSDGDIVWDASRGDFDFKKTNALPAVLAGAFLEEPLHTDLRWARGQDGLGLTHPRFRDAVLNVAAPLRGVSKDVLDGSDVRQLRKNRRLVRSLFASIALAAVFAGWQWWQASQQRDEAQAQARSATSRKLVADSRLPELSLDARFLLAAEAYQVAPTSEAHENLIRLVHDNDRFIQFLHSPESPITAVAYSRARNTLITGDEQGRLGFWRMDAQRAQPAFEPIDVPGQAHGSPVLEMQVATDGGSVTVAHGDGSVKIIDPGESTAVPRLLTSCSGWGPATVALNGDGSRAVVRALNGRAGLWKIATSGCTELLPLVLPAKGAVTVSASGHELAAPQSPGALAWWRADGRQGTAQPAAGAATSNYGSALRFSDDGRWVAAANSATLTIWKVAPDGTWQVALSASMGAQPLTVSFSPAANKLAVGLDDGTVDLWRLDSTPAVRERLAGHRHGYHVTDLAFNENGTLLASAAEDGVVMLWYLGIGGRDKAIARELRGHVQRVRLLKFMDRRRLLSVSGTAAILWDVSISGDRPFLSYLSRNVENSSYYYDPVANLRLSLPGILLTDRDKDGCALVADAQRNAGRSLAQTLRDSLLSNLRYVPTCPRAATR